MFLIPWNLHVERIGHKKRLLFVGQYDYLYRVIQKSWLQEDWISRTIEVLI